MKSLIAATIFLTLSLDLCGYNHRSRSSFPAIQEFWNKNLFFDLDHEVERYPCQIQGTIPEWLSGTLLRNGPAKFTVGGEKRVGWFDGLAMLHAFEFNHEKVFYSNRFLRSEQYFIMMDEKSLNFSGFAQDPCPIVFKNQTARFIPEDMKNIPNAVVTIQDYADKMVALTEIPLPVVFDPNTVKNDALFNFQDQLKEGQWVSAHPQHDIIAKETVNYFIRFGKKSKYVIWKMQDHQSHREIIAEIPIDLPSYMHSFALTEHYVILVEFPFVVNPLDLMEKKKPFIFNYKWKPERGTRFLIVDRSTGKLETITTEPFFAFHHVNAFDRDGKIYIDIVTHPNAKVIDMITGRIKEKNQIQHSEITKMQRFTVDLATKTLSSETLFDKTIEMPRVPLDKTAHAYRFAYVTDFSFPMTKQDIKPLYKVDTVAKNAISWSLAGCSPGEPIFVSHPKGKKEDDGVVLSVVLDLAHHRSFLLILNAADFKELARVDVPHAIPFALHGLWKGAS